MGNHGATPPLLSPPTTPSGPRATGAPALHPPEAEGTSPSPQRGRDAGGGAQLSPHAARPHTPHRLLLGGQRQAGEPVPAHKDDKRTTPWGGTRTRTGAVCT